ncbi:hypothetical protein X777_01278 [Ooceraea biroi]|uniref:Uncharacterized protein n=1 Tax=Ooceraea biroi TaxID=2015173 RepID=A0A026WRK2_OOCBI|nr:hypothetical protein X777_01278 [Ooceraea biroi]
MLVASLQVAASKCCHAAAVPAGGPKLAAGLDTDPDQTRSLLPERRTRAADRSANNPDRPEPRGLVSGCDPLRLAHRRDEERTDTWNTSGTYRFFLLYSPRGNHEDRKSRGRKRMRYRAMKCFLFLRCGSGFGYSGQVENDRVHSDTDSARCKWRCVIRGSARRFSLDSRYYAVRRACPRAVQRDGRDLWSD